MARGSGGVALTTQGSSVSVRDESKGIVRVRATGGATNEKSDHRKASCAAALSPLCQRRLRISHEC